MEAEDTPGGYFGVPYSAGTSAAGAHRPGRTRGTIEVPRYSRCHDREDNNIACGQEPSWEKDAGERGTAEAQCLSLVLSVIHE